MAIKITKGSQSVFRDLGSPPWRPSTFGSGPN